MKRRYLKPGVVPELSGHDIPLRDVLLSVGSERHTVTERGKPVARSLLEVLVLRIRKAALEDRNASAIKLMQKLDKMTASRSGPQAGYILTPGDLSVEEWAAWQEERAKTAKHPDELYGDLTRDPN